MGAARDASTGSDDDRGGFTDRLAVTLTLTIAGTAHVIDGGGVDELALDLRSYGFSGEVAFLVQDDAAHGGGFTDDLLADFLKPDLIEVALTVAPVLLHPEADAAEPITVAGLVTAKSVAEVVYRRAKVDEMQILVRRYRIAFADPARVLWTQHHPVQLYTDKSMVDVINDHLGDKITVAYDFSALAESRRLTFLHLPETAGASFWDFVSWYLDGCAGVLFYDYAAAAYQIAAAKPEAGAAIQLFGDDLAHAELRYPAVPRHQPVVLNAHADSPRTEPVTQAQAATGIRRDVLLCTPIAQAVDDQLTLEGTRTVVPLLEAHLRFARMPSTTLVPGAVVALAAANRWSSESAMIGLTWRVRRLRLSAAAPARALDQDLQLDSTGYRVEVGAELEQVADPRIERPPFRAPRYPGFVEGKVVSEQGEEADKTYQVYRDDDTSLDEYQVKVPLWADQIVRAPFEPIFGSGNVYLPSYRAERVQLALDVHDARIARLLEWRAGAALSMEVQGEHILFGKSDTSQTSVKHVYDGDKPELHVKRTNARDTALIRLTEGTMFLQVKEEEEA